MNLENNILITIAMPVYNAGVFLKPAIESIIQQTHKNWELIIIDDGSTDQAVENLQKNGFLNDHRISVIKDGLNKGLAVRLNETIMLGKGRFFARMDQDDISLPNRLEEQLAFLTSHPEVDLLATRVERINFNGELVGQLPFALTHETICAKPWRSFYMPHPTWMGKMDWFRCFKYASPAPYLCEDQELLTRAYLKSNFACLDKVLFHYRIRDKLNIRKLWRTYFSVYKMQCTNFFQNNLIYILPASVVFLGRNIKVVTTLIKQLVR